MTEDDYLRTIAHLCNQQRLVAANIDATFQQLRQQALQLQEERDKAIASGTQPEPMQAPSTAEPPPQ